MVDKPIVKSPNALWEFILNELRTSAFHFGPAFKEIAELAIPQPGTDRSPKMEYEQLLNQLDDAIELCKTVDLNQSEKKTVSLSRVAEDFSEAYTRRFGPARAATVSLTVDPELPLVKGYPQQMVRILDALVRAGHQGNPDREVDFIIRDSRKPGIAADSCEVLLSCKGISFSIKQVELRELLAEFEVGNYLASVKSLGLPLCTALHVAHSLNASVSIKSVESGVGEIEFRFVFEKLQDAVTLPTVPDVFYLVTKSKQLENTIRKIAGFHSSKVIVLESGLNVPDGVHILFDARELTPLTMDLLKDLPRPAQTTLILSSNEIVTWRELSRLGFANFATVPLVSTKVLQCIAGASGYVRPHSEQEVSSLRKLRILVVDDTATARIVLKDHLELDGHGVIEATDGTELVTQIKSGGRFDIIFCDQTMTIS